VQVCVSICIWEQTHDTNREANKVWFYVLDDGGATVDVDEGENEEEDVDVGEDVDMDEDVDVDDGGAAGPSGVVRAFLRDCVLISSGWSELCVVAVACLLSSFSPSLLLSSVCSPVAPVVAAAAAVSVLLCLLLGRRFCFCFCRDLARIRFAFFLVVRRSSCSAFCNRLS
jgi:hypothetical protein